MSDLLPEVVRCKYCGLENDAGLAVCVHCSSPLTAYGGQVIGEQYEGRLAEQVARLQVRPPSIVALTVFNVLFALFGPIGTVLRSFGGVVKVNEEGTNHIGAAFSAIGPFMAALVFLPVAIALCVVAWATITQRTWAWVANWVTLGLCALMGLKMLGSSPLFGIVCLGVAGALAFLWMKPESRAWYGHMS